MTPPNDLSEAASHPAAVAWDLQLGLLDCLTPTYDSFILWVRACTQYTGSSI